MDVATSKFVGHPAPVPGGDDRCSGVAVIAAIPGDDLVASGDQARHPDGVLVGVGAAIGEEHLVEALGRAVEDQLGCLGPSLIGVRRSDGRQLLHLLDDAGDDLGVLVPEVGEDELAGEVEVALAVVVPDGAALTAGDGERGKRALGRPGVEDPGSVSGGDVCGGHGSIMPCPGCAGRGMV